MVKARSRMKREAKYTNHKTTNIVTGNIAGLVEEELARLPNIETLRRDVRRNRNRNMLVVPDVNDKLFDIPPEYATNELGQEFLLYDNRRQDRMLIFGTPESRQFLSNADDWFLDGTFKSSPPQFAQLYTVHGLKDSRNVVGLYALLPNKTMAT